MVLHGSFKSLTSELSA